ncbi:Regulatory protein, TetR [Cupriavidus phytorum]|uniref:Regulatory protein, TetR n=2 Tax=Cupriavidus TaxID=106589 RepID=A0A976ABV6_9BURK|nr:TetR family transcriptional regulator [Cupriavidus alkaliphilus]SOY76120.1 Regulatory protein, TetR [Cupriavidus taiwanensis]
MSESLTVLAGHSGYSVPRNTRGMRTTQQLLEAGRRLLRRRFLDEVSIQEICASANVTTGAFYKRFDGKEAYFKALQTLLIAKLREATTARMAELDARPWTLREVTEVLARNLRLWVCRNEGVLRASLVERASTHDPIRAVNLEYVEQLVPRLAKMHPRGPSPELESVIRFAYQSMIGTLVFTLINRTGSYALTDRRLEQAMAKQFYLFVTQGLD